MKGLDTYRKERQAGQQVPLCAQLTEHIGQTRAGALAVGFELIGTAFEAKTDEQRAIYKDGLNVWLRNIADPRLALWSIMLRRRFVPDLARNYANPFAQRVHDRYVALMCERPLYRNTWYLVLVLRVLGLNERVPRSERKDRGLVRELVLAGIETLDALSDRLEAGLAEYEPRRLGLRCDGHNRFSELGELYADILNGERTPVPVGPYDLGQAVGCNRLLFGREILEVRAPGGSRYAAALGIKEYVAETYPDMCEAVWRLPMPVNWIQSFCFLDKEKAKGLFATQHRRLVATGDEGLSQVEALGAALDDLVSNRFVAGEHNASLVVWAERPDSLQQQVAIAHAALSDPGFVAVREDLALPAHIFSALPGGAALRPRKSVVTSLNFASLSPFLCYPMGRAEDHHWGEAVSLFRSTISTPVWFSPHVGDLGHALVVGMSGSGKTNLLAFLLAQLQRFPVRHFVLDKDQGLRLAILALGGNYLTLEYGRATGLNPFALPLDERHAGFLHDFVRLLAGEPWTAKASKEVDEAIASLYRMDPHQRRLRTLVRFLDQTREEGVAARLRPWVDQGRYAWCFDGEYDTLRLDRLTAVDITQFLEDPTVRTPVSAYLLYRAEAAIDGQPFTLWIDEFWRILDDQYFAAFVRDQLKTMRKKNAMLMAFTQSASDALNSEIASAVLEQTATKIFFPNEYASEEEYCVGFKLTPAEWQLFAPLTKGTRRFLLKQAELSALIDFDLRGMEPEMRVLSGTEQRIATVDRLAQAHGGALPADWLTRLEAEGWS